VFAAAARTVSSVVGWFSATKVVHATTCRIDGASLGEGGDDGAPDLDRPRVGGGDL